MGKTCHLRTARRDGGSLPLGTRLARLGQCLLRRGGASRDQELEGLLLRLFRRFELHNRRQATGRALGDGALGPYLRPQLVEPPRAPGRGRRRDRRIALRHREAVVRPVSRSHRRLRGGTHAGRGFDVPIRQPGRTARAAAHGRRIRDHSSTGERPDTLARTGDVTRRNRVHHQDAAGIPGPARDRSCLPLRRAAEAGAPCRSARPQLGSAPRRLRMVGDDRRARPGTRSSLHRRLAEQQPFQPHLRLQRLRPGDGQ